MFQQQLVASEQQMPRHPTAINPPTSLQPAAREPLPLPGRRAKRTHGRGEGGTEARGRRFTGGRLPRRLVCFPLLVLSADGRRASRAYLCWSQQLAQLDANCVLAAAGASGCRGYSSHTVSQVMHALHGCHVRGCKGGVHTEAWRSRRNLCTADRVPCHRAGSSIWRAAEIKDEQGENGCDHRSTDHHTLCRTDASCVFSLRELGPVLLSRVGSRLQRPLFLQHIQQLTRLFPELLDTSALLKVSILTPHISLLST
ncbi:hypothetical protein Q8A73_011209 [Channa argus]|nr:hypothetical protein Q8A73_011209 [Channa argus]